MPLTLRAEGQAEDPRKTNVSRETFARGKRGAKERGRKRRRRRARGSEKAEASKRERRPAAKASVTGPSRISPRPPRTHALRDSFSQIKHLFKKLLLVLHTRAASRYTARLQLRSCPRCLSFAHRKILLITGCYRSLRVALRFALCAHTRREIPPKHRTQPPAAVPRARRTISQRYARSVISATSCSSASFSHCASGVMMLPSDVEANPHCVATHSFSAG